MLDKVKLKFGLVENLGLTYLTCWLLYLGGIGRSDGALGRRSRGEPISHGGVFPSHP